MNGTSTTIAEYIAYLKLLQLQNLRRELTMYKDKKKTWEGFKNGQQQAELCGQRISLIEAEIERRKRL